jgi:hypothetical protein
MYLAHKTHVHLAHMQSWRRDHSNGDYASDMRCWRIRIAAPPVFVTDYAGNSFVHTCFCMCCPCFCTSHYIGVYVLQLLGFCRHVPAQRCLFFINEYVFFCVRLLVCKHTYIHPHQVKHRPSQRSGPQSWTHPRMRMHTSVCRSS